MSVVNEVNPLGILDPSVYSNRKFIDYIKAILKGEDDIAVQNEYEAGNKLSVSVEALPGGIGSKVRYKYQEVNTPLGDVDQFVAEYGKQYPALSEDILVEVTRRTYPLNSIEFPNSSPAISEDYDSLTGVGDGDVFSRTVKNLVDVDGDGTEMAMGGSFSDINGNGGVLQSRISRQARQFYGLVTDLEVPDNADILAMDSSLGSLPGAITVDHGPTPTRLCIVTTKSDVVVSASGFEVGMQKFASVSITPYAADLAYTKTYNIFIQTQGTFNPFTYKVS